MAFGSGIKFLTSYRYFAQMLNMLNHMTFLYNPNWDYQDGLGYPTFPIAFYHVKKFTDMSQSEVQTKKVMFYNSQSSSNEDMVKGAVTDVIADNIVNRPKTYRMEVIVPSEDLTLLFNTAYLNAESMANVISFIAEKDNRMDNTVMNTIRASITPIATVARTLIKSLLSALYGDVSSFISSLTSSPKYNHNSLDAMWRNRTILKMKMYDGWNFRYVVITDMQITKEPTEDGVEEAVLTLTEVPMMTLRSQSEAYNMKKYSASAISLATGTAKASSAIWSGTKWVASKVADATVSAVKATSKFIADGDLTASASGEDKFVGVKINF